MSHSLVYWIKENKYSVVAVRKFQCQKEELKQPELLVGKVINVRWNKNGIFPAEIRAIGEKLEMKKLETVEEAAAIDISFSKAEVQEASNPLNQIGINLDCVIITPSEGNNLSKADSGSELRSDAEGVDGAGGGVMGNGADAGSTSEGFEQSFTGGVPQLVLLTNEAQIQKLNNLPEEALAPSSSSNFVVVEFANLEERVQHLEQEVRERDLIIANEKARNSRLKCLLKKTVPADSNDVVTIAPNIQILKSLDDLLKSSYTTRPSVFLRRLMFDAGIFTIEDVGASSLGGKRSNASPVVLREALDPVKFKALKDYTISTCQLDPKSVEMVLFEQRIRNICTDARKKLKIAASKLN